MEKCEVSRYCGGCQYQGISYDKQLAMKQQKLEKLLSSFGKVMPIIGMEDPLHYRNKVQVTFGKDEHGNIVMGNYVTSTHTIVPVKNCLICDQQANEIIDSIYRTIKRLRISVFDERAMKGCMRHILVRCTSNGEYMVVLVTGSGVISRKDELVNDIIRFNPEVKTIVQNINNRRSSMVLGNRNIAPYGKGCIIDELCGKSFRISASSFYQVNKRQTEVLYGLAIKAAKFKGNQTIIDAYCGIGTIGIVASDHVKKVIGVESNESAIRDAISNARYNDVKNIEFVLDDAGRFMEKTAKEKAHIDALIMDPPRSGADRKFMDSIFRLAPERIVYVSCNPITLKDNLSYLSRMYRVASIQPVDMFPFTDHVECVTSLSKI